MAVYRPDPELLAMQLASIRTQTVRGWRCLIGIDGRSHGTLATVQTLIAHDSRFAVYEFQENVGFYRNFERLLERVPLDADWVALADQDDEWFGEKLEMLLPHLAEASLAMGQAVIVNASARAKALGTTARTASDLTAILIDNQVTGSLSVFRRELLGRALPFPPPTDLAFHDHWLAVCALVEDGINIIDVPVQLYVQHVGNVIGEERNGQFRGRLRRLFHAKANRGIAAPIDYLSRERWGWRAAMAQHALKASRIIRENDALVLGAFAADRFNARLGVLVATQILRRRVPLLRAVALLTGALNAPGAHRRRRRHLDSNG